LDHVQHNLIGDETTRGVSGGQRKRVNIGMELAAVVAVIHQPRFEIFQQFDEILMIAPGGQTAYLGPTSCVIEYFESLGFYFDPRSNPADILMDILSDKGVNLAQHLTPADLVKKWESNGQKWLKEHNSEDDDDTEHFVNMNNTTPSDLSFIVQQRGASFWIQSWLCHNRYLIQQYRRIGALGLEIGVASLAGGLMGIAVSSQKGVLFVGVPISPYSLFSSSTLVWLIPQLGLLIGMSCGLAGAPAGVKVFGEEQTVYWREAAAG
ncbi:hypothetical protein HDU76_005060, partial [Blyttiomyces sp. JEL0837]